MKPYKILLVGASGKGKTYSFRNLDKTSTIFLNIEDKPLPFGPMFRMYDEPSTVDAIFDALERCCQTKTATSVVVDSFSAFLDLNMAESRQKFKGWDIMNAYNANIGRFNSLIKRIPVETFVTAHYEYVGDEGTMLKEKRVKTKGKEWEGAIEKDYTVVIYTYARVINPTLPPQHYFRLMTDGTDSAKTPPQIFGDTVVEVENDAQVVLQKIKDFKAQSLK